MTTIELQPAATWRDDVGDELLADWPLLTYIAKEHGAIEPEDAVADAVASVWEWIARGRSVQRPRALLITAIRRRAMNQLRDYAVRRRHEKDLAAAAAAEEARQLRDYERADDGGDVARVRLGQTLAAAQELPDAQRLAVSAVVARFFARGEEAKRAAGERQSHQHNMALMRARRALVSAVG